MSIHPLIAISPALHSPLPRLVLRVGNLNVDSHQIQPSQNKYNPEKTCSTLRMILRYNLTLTLVFNLSEFILPSLL